MVNLVTKVVGCKYSMKSNASSACDYDKDASVLFPPKTSCFRGPFKVEEQAL